MRRKLRLPLSMLKEEAHDMKSNGSPTTAKDLRILVVEDSDDDALLLRRQLEASGFRVEMRRVATRAALSDAMSEKSWDIVFSDFSMPNFDGMQALQTVREYDKDIPFLVVSGTIGEERAAQLMKLGAQDYLLKGNIRRLVPAVERELREAQLRREHRLAHEHIQRLAYYDSVTQLPNRHRLMEDLQLRAGQPSPLALLIVNLVNFHEINEAFGYKQGDDVISEVAKRLQESGIAETQFYHLHGNEFAVLVPSYDRPRIEQLAQNILKAIGQHQLSAGFRIHVGARIGIALSPAIEANKLLQQAGMAVTIAKREGKALAWYEPARDPSSPESLSLLADLHDAINSEHLFLVFQPKVQCRSGKVVGGEALLRWRHPERGMIPPDIFIRLAEKSGLIDELMSDVVNRVLDQVISWRARGPIPPVAVNLSARNLLNPQLIAQILDLSRRANSNERGVEIEITETALMRDPDQALMTLKRFYDAGIRIFIDDFGTGFSSLGYLKKLPIDAIKIDKSFVLDLPQSEDSDIIVRSTISLAHNLGLKVVAEGVENRETWEQLKDYECDEAQGYYFARPLLADEFAVAVNNWVPK